MALFFSVSFFVIYIYDEIKYFDFLVSQDTKQHKIILYQNKGQKIMGSSHILFHIEQM